MPYSALPLAQLLADLSARTPAPGGGSGCAAAAAIGAALGAMVAAFSPPKGSDPAAEARVRDLLARLAASRDRFAALIDEDASAYDGIRAAKKAKAGDDAVQRAIVHAMEVPLGGVRAAHEALSLVRDLCRDSNPRLVTDLACGAVLLESALVGMAFNVRVNLLDIKEEQTVRAAGEDLDRLSRSAGELRRSILDHVQSKLGA